MFYSYKISIALFLSNSNSLGWAQEIICRFRVTSRPVSLYVSLIFHWTTVLKIRNFCKCNVVYIELPAEEQIWNSCGGCMMLESKARKPSRDAVQKEHTGSGTDRNFFFSCLIPNRESEQELLLQHLLWLPPLVTGLVIFVTHCVCLVFFLLFWFCRINEFTSMTLKQLSLLSECYAVLSNIPGTDLQIF